MAGYGQLPPGMAANLWPPRTPATLYNPGVFHKISA